MSSIVVQSLRRVILPVAALLAVMVSIGLLITRVLEHAWPFTVEDTVNRELAAERSGDLNNVSLVFSTIANTEVIIAVTALAALVFWLVHRHWREPLFLAAAVSAQALVFLVTTMAIKRQRPAVEHMDGSLPTSSFPSGHTSAAVALYVGIAVLLAARARSTGVKVAWFSLLVLVPIGVAVTRMYRGMHHPSDVVASFLNGLTCVAIMARSILDRAVRWGRERLSGTPRPAASSVPAG